MESNKIILASNNKHKIIEFTSILKEFNIEVICQNEAGVNIEVEENGKTFEENAILKANEIYVRTKMPVISDDSGIVIDFLNGMPGVQSHRFLRRRHAS